ncbi:unnamed protein product [Rotaria sp. Silwood2]|nr:unnamed protein product [Rotaria sp. Silwood2]
MYNLNHILNFLMKSIRNSNKNSFFIQYLYKNYLLELILSHLQLLYSPNLKYSSEIFLSIYLQDNLNYLKENFSNQFIQKMYDYIKV